MHISIHFYHMDLYGVQTQMPKLFLKIRKNLHELFGNSEEEHRALFKKIKHSKTMVNLYVVKSNLCTF